MVTYEQLKSRYVLQQGDKLALHGLNYEVKLNRGNYLFHIDGVNSRVFDILRMGAEERETFVKKFNPIHYAEARGAFPEFSDLKALTNLVIALYEVPEYKEGDWVTVLPRGKANNHSPVCYAEWMQSFAGKTYQINGHNLREETNKCNGVDNGDPHTYILYRADAYWTTQMIRPATQEEIKTAKGKSDFDINIDKLASPPEPLCGSPVVYKSDENHNKIIEEYIKEEFSHPLTVKDTRGSIQSMYVSSWVDEDRIKEMALATKKERDSEIRLPKNEDSTPHIKL